MTSPTTRRRFRRVLATSIATAMLVTGGVALGAAPASAADSATKIYFKSAASRVDTYSAKGVVRGSGSAVNLTFGYATRYASRHLGPAKPKLKTITVQRAVGKGWHTIKKHVKVKNISGQRIRVVVPAYKVPAGTAYQVVKYRVKVKKKGLIVKGDTAHPISIKYQNQSMYSGIVATLYHDMAPYCPTAAVRLDPSLSARGWAGVFQAGKSIAFDPSVESYSPINRLAVALHECGHLRQFYNYGQSYVGDAKQKKAAAKIFVQDVDPANPAARPYAQPFDPEEHAADCASHSINPAGYLGYGGYCNPRELAAGLALMHGKRY